MLHLAFEGKTATAKDLSGKGNHGKIVNAKRVKAGKKDGGLYLDGSNDRVHVPNSASIEVRSQVTVALWVNLASFNPRGYGNEHGYIVNKGNDLWWNPAFYLGYSKSKTGKTPAMFHVCRHGAAQRGGGKTVMSTTILAPKRWYHLAGTYDGKQLKIYVNGTFEQAQAYTGKLRADRAPLFVGGGKLFGTNWGNHFTVNGTVDDVMVWNRALDAGEVRDLYHGVLDGGVYVERSPLVDRVTLTDGKKMTGTILNASYTATASFGKITLPAARLAGFVRAGRDSPQVKLALLDGQIVAATPAERTIRLKIVGGSVLTVPLGRIASCGYRRTAARPAVTPLGGPAVALRNGNHLRLKAMPKKLSLKTPYATIAIPPAGVMRIEATDRAGRGHHIRLAGGSKLIGMLAPATMTLPLSLGPEVTAAAKDVLCLTGPNGTVRKAGPATVVMTNGDQLVGRLAGKTLAIATEFGHIAPDLAAVRSITTDAKTGTITMTMRDGTVHRGRPGGRFALTLPGAATLNLPAKHIASITQSRP